MRPRSWGGPKHPLARCSRPACAVHAGSSSGRVRNSLCRLGIRVRSRVGRVVPRTRRTPASRRRRRPVHRFDAVSGDRVQHTGIALHGHLQGAGDPCAVPKPRGPAVGPVKGGKRVLVATDRPSAAAFENRRAKTGLSQTECCHRTAEPATDDDGRRRVRGLRGVRGSAGGRRHRGERPEADRTPKDSSPGHDRAPAHLVDIDLCPTYRDGRRLHGPTVGPRT